MSRPADMKPGDFYAACHRLREDHAERHDAGEDTLCSEEFHDYASAEAHTREVHPRDWREMRRVTKGPEMAKPRTRPWNAPVVKLEKQRVAPGTPLEYMGHPCQVIGAASATRTLLIATLPIGTEPLDTNARRVIGSTDRDDETVVWELTVPTADVERVVRG